MDTESHLQKIMEAQVRQTRMLVWILLVLVLALLLAVCLGLLLVAVHFGFVRVSDLRGYFGLILVLLALIPIVYLLVLVVGSSPPGWPSSGPIARRTLKSSGRPSPSEQKLYAKTQIRDGRIVGARWQMQNSARQPVTSFYRLLKALPCLPTLPATFPASLGSLVLYAREKDLATRA